MNGRRLLPTFLLASLCTWAGCNSSSEETSYELVEPAKQLASREVQKPASDEVGSSGATVPDNTQLNVPPTAEPEVKPADIRDAVTGSLPQTGGVDLAAASTSAPPAEGLPDANRLASAETGVGSLLPSAVAAEIANPAVAGSDSLKNLIPNKIELKVPHKDFSREGRERAFRVTYDDIDLLKILNMEPVPLNAEEYLPDWLKALDGQTVRLRGWMFPPLMTEGLSSFLFVRDNQICCFGREAKVYDKVRVTMKEGTTTDYIFGRPFDVVGTFRIESEESDGELFFLYSIDDAAVMK